MNKKYFQKTLSIFLSVLLLTCSSFLIVKTQGIEVRNQNNFTSIPGFGYANAKRIFVGNDANDKMKVCALSTQNYIYVYNPQNDIKTQNWDALPSKVKMIQLAIGDDGTLIGIDGAGKIYIRKNDSWEQTSSGKAQYVDVANKGLMVSINKGKVYLSEDMGNSWKELPGNISNFVNVSVSGDETIIGCTANHTAYFFDGKEWIKMPDESQSLKKVSVGSGTQIYGINKDNILIRFNVSSKKWEIPRNLIFTEETKDKSIKVEDVSVNKDGNVFCISGQDGKNYDAKKFIFSNVIINLTEEQKKLMPNTTVTINYSGKFVVVGEKDYLNVEDVEQNDPKAHFKIMRSAQFVGLKSEEDKTAQIYPEGSWLEITDPVGCMSENFFLDEGKWIFDGSLEKATLQNFGNKKYLSVIPDIKMKYEEEELKKKKGIKGLRKEIKKLRKEKRIGIKELKEEEEKGKRKKIRELKKEKKEDIKELKKEKKEEREEMIEMKKKGKIEVPDYFKEKVLLFAYSAQLTEGETFKFNIVEIQPAAVELTTKNDQFIENYKFEKPGHGHILFTIKGTGNLRLWLWDKDKKLKRLVTIGGWDNKKVSLGTKEGWDHFVEETQILKPEFSDFYISLKDKTLTFGQGNLIGKNILGTSKEDPELNNVVYFTFSKLPGAKVEMKDANAYTWLLGEKEED